MKRFLEKAVKWLLTASGFVTSLVILLIIGFLFTEGRATSWPYTRTIRLRN